MNKLMLVATCGVLAFGVACSKSNDSATEHPAAAGGKQDKVVASADKQGLCTTEVINDLEDLKTYLAVRYENDSWKAAAKEHCNFFKTKYGSNVNCVILPDIQVNSAQVNRTCENATFDSPVVFE